MSPMEEILHPNHNILPLMPIESYVKCIQYNFKSPHSLHSPHTTQKAKVQCSFTVQGTLLAANPCKILKQKKKVMQFLWYGITIPILWLHSKEKQEQRKVKIQQGKQSLPFMFASRAYDSISGIPVSLGSLALTVLKCSLGTFLLVWLYLVPLVFQDSCSKFLAFSIPLPIRIHLQNITYWPFRMSFQIFP